MGYYVIETQTNETGSAIVNYYDNRPQAEQKYHLILSAAAVSNVQKHGAILVEDNYGLMLREVYDRTTDVEPEERIMTNEN